MGAKKGRIPWNKGKHYKDILSPEIAEKMTEVARRNILQARISLQDPEKSKAAKEKLSSIAKKRNLGGYQPRSGRGLKGWYKGYWCDSSYELAFVLYYIEHSIPFKRNTEKFPYLFGGQIYNWIPDFIVGDGYVEIKGFFRPKDHAKILEFKGKIEVLHGEKLKPILDYAATKYGKSFTHLYENAVFKGCGVCNKPLPKWNRTNLCGDHRKKPEGREKRAGQPKVSRIRPKVPCKGCGGPIGRASSYCVSCSSKQSRKFDPSREELIHKLEQLRNLSIIGRDYGVSGNAVKKRCKKLNIDYRLFDGRKN